MSRAKRRLDPGEGRRRQSRPLYMVEAAGVEPERTLEESATYRKEYTAKGAKTARVGVRKYILGTRYGGGQDAGRRTLPISLDDDPTS